MKIVETGAVISDCEKFRYRLWRYWNKELNTLGFVMLNPSTADAFTDDATIRKCIGFASRLGFGGIEIANLYAYRARHPGALKYVRDVIGPDNDKSILSMARTSQQVVVAWGGNAYGHQRAYDVVHELHADGHPTYCLSLNRDGTPAHPLMLPYTCQLSEYDL